MPGKWGRADHVPAEAAPPALWLLDQVSSQRLVRVAAEIGRTPVPSPPATRVTEVDHSLRRRRQVGLGFFFLALSLFALGGMVFQSVTLGEDGWGWWEGIQLALMLTLLIAVFGQSRGLLRALGPGRGFLSAVGSGRDFLLRRPGPGSVANVLPMPPGLALLDATSHGQLESAGLPAQRRQRSGRRRPRSVSRQAHMALLVFSLVVSVGALVAGLLLIPYLMVRLGSFDPAVLLTVPFTALSGYAAYQFVRGAFRSSFRGRTYYLASRAFRDSIRAWGSGSLLARVALTGTAAASVAGVGFTNFVIDRPVRADLLVFDSGDATLHRINLGDGANVTIGEAALGVNVLSMVTLPRDAVGESGRTAPKAAVLALVAGPRSSQALAVLSTGGARGFVLSSLATALSRPMLAVFPNGQLFAMDGSGTVWRIDPSSGIATQVAATGLRVSAFAYDPGARAFLAIAGPRAVHISPTGAVADVTLLGLTGLDVCSLLYTPSGWFAGDRLSGQIVVLDPATGVNRGVVVVDGQTAFAQPCSLTLAPPRGKVEQRAVATPPP